MKNIKYLPLFFFCSYAIKSLILRPSLEEAAILLALAGMTYGFEFFTEKKKINECFQKVEDVSLRVEELTKKTDNNQTQIASVKLSSGIRTQRMS